MKIAISSDWHIDAVTAGVERLPEVEHHVNELALFGRNNPASGLIVMGDYFDPGGRRDVVHAAWLIRAWRKLQQEFAWSVWLAGNHDVLEILGDGRDGSDSAVTTLEPLIAASRGDAMNTCCAQVPTWARFGRIGVVAMPFVASVVRRTGDIWRNIDLAVVNEAATVLDDRVVDVVVVAGHRTIAGVVPGSETTVMPRGGDYPFPPAALELYRRFPGRVVLANGHYHEPQTFWLDGCPIVIPGCPFRATFGELGGPDRGFVVIDTEAMTPRPIRTDIMEQGR